MSIDNTQQLDPWLPLEMEVVNAMLDLAGVKPGDKFVDLGCGDGRFLKEAEARGSQVSGVELDPILTASSINEGLNITNGDLFEFDCSKATVVTFWFTVGVYEVLDKLYKELKAGSRLVCLHSSRRQFRDGVYVPEESYLIPDHIWKPSDYRDVLGNRIYLYIR